MIYILLTSQMLLYIHQIYLILIYLTLYFYIVMLDHVIIYNEYVVPND